MELCMLQTTRQIINEIILFSFVFVLGRVISFFFFFFFFYFFFAVFSWICQTIVLRAIIVVFNNEWEEYAAKCVDSRVQSE